MSDLLDALRAHAPGDAVAAVDAAKLEEAAHLIAGVATGWPHAGTSADFVAYVASRVPADKPLDESLEQLRLADLALAWACARGDRDALRSFRALHHAGLCAAARRAGPEHQVDDVAQRVLTRLLVADGERRPAIENYAGRGSLKSWLQVTAMREARDALRGDRGRREARGAEIDRLMDATVHTAHDPELEALKGEYRARFKEAFQRAFAELDPEERTLLRHEHLDGLDGAQIGAIYGVHKATISRWRARARESLFRATRAIAEREMNLTPREFESVMRLVQSQLDLSLTRVLRGSEPSKGGPGR